MAGYRTLPASDPEENRLRVAYHAAESNTERQQISEQLSAYLWSRVKAEIDEDKRKHPKAKRNMPVGSDTTQAPLNIPDIE